MVASALGDALLSMIASLTNSGARFVSVSRNQSHTVITVRDYAKSWRIRCLRVAHTVVNPLEGGVLGRNICFLGNNYLSIGKNGTPKGGCPLGEVHFTQSSVTSFGVKLLKNITANADPVWLGLLESNQTKKNRIKVFKQLIVAITSTRDEV